MNNRHALHHPIGPAKDFEPEAALRVTETPHTRVVWDHETAKLVRTVLSDGRVTFGIRLDNATISFGEDGNRATKVFEKLISGPFTVSNDDERREVLLGDTRELFT